MRGKREKKIIISEFNVVKANRVSGMATGSRYGDTVQGNTAGEHGRRTVGKVAGMHTPQPLREPLPHQRVRPRVRSVLGQLHQ